MRFKMVWSTRFSSVSGGSPALRRLGISLFRSVVSFFMRQRITDPTSGFQALNSRVLRFFSGDTYPVDYPASAVLLALHFAGFRVEEVPVTMRERLGGESMHSGLRPIYYIFKMWLAIAIVLLRQKTHLSARRMEP